MSYNQIHFTSCSSTMDKAKDWIRTNPEELITVIHSDSQTQGYGKPGNTWISDLGNLYMTVIVPEGLVKINLTELSFLMATVIGDALLKVDPTLNLQYKWPNDILIDEKKVGGVLLEPFESSILIGIGINIQNHPVHLSATCLQEHAVSLRPDVLLSHIMDFFLISLIQSKNNSFEKIRLSWLKRAFGLKKSMIVASCGLKKQGIFIGLDDNGNLLLEKKDGTKWRLASGDIMLGR